MFLITGATGNVGRHVTAELHAQGRPVRALTRNPDATFPEGVDVVHGDLSAPASLDSALTAVDTVFLVWPTLAADHAAPETLQTIAKHARRIVYLSARGVPDDPAEQPGSIIGSHTRLERLIEESGLDWTFLRPDGFATNTLHWADQIRTEGVVRQPFGAAARPLIHEKDIATVAVHTLTEPGHTGARYELTGPEVLTQYDQVRIIGEAIGRATRWEDIPRSAALSQMVKDGWPPTAAEGALDAWAQMATNPSPTTTTVPDLTGASARTFQQWAADHATDFR